MWDWETSERIIGFYLLFLLLFVIFYVFGIIIGPTCVDYFKSIKFGTYQTGYKDGYIDACKDQQNGTLKAKLIEEKTWKFIE